MRGCGLSLNETAEISVPYIIDIRGVNSETDE